MYVGWCDYTWEAADRELVTLLEPSCHTVELLYLQCKSTAWLGAFDHGYPRGILLHLLFHVCVCTLSLSHSFCKWACCVIHLSAKLMSNTSPHMHTQKSVLGFKVFVFAWRKLLISTTVIVPFVPTWWPASNIGYFKKKKKKNLVVCVSMRTPWIFLMKYESDIIAGLSASELQCWDALWRRSGKVCVVSCWDIPGRGGTDVLRGLSSTRRKRSLQGRRCSEHVRVWRWDWLKMLYYLGTPLDSELYIFYIFNVVSSDCFKKKPKRQKCKKK